VVLAVAHLPANLVSAAANSQLSALVCKRWGCLDNGATRALTRAAAGFTILVTLIMIDCMPNSGLQHHACWAGPATLVITYAALITTTYTELIRR
jgi:hypothetical protein